MGLNRGFPYRRNVDGRSSPGWAYAPGVLVGYSTGSEGPTGRQYLLPFSHADYTVSVSEAMTVVEAVGVVLRADIDVADSISLTGSLTARYAALGTVSEALSLSATVTSRVAASVAVSESLAVVESATALLGASVAVAEALATAATTTALVGASAAVAESLAVVEAASASAGLTEAVSESLAVVESLAASAGVAVSVTESMSVTESVTESVQPGVPAGEGGFPADEHGGRPFGGPFYGGGSGADVGYTVESDCENGHYAGCDHDDDHRGWGERVLDADEEAEGFTDEAPAPAGDVEEAIEYTVTYAKRGAPNLFMQAASVANPSLDEASMIVPGAIAYGATRIFASKVGPHLHAAHGEGLAGAIAMSGLWWASSKMKRKDWKAGVRVGSAIALVEILVKRYAPALMPGTETKKVTIPVTPAGGVTFLE